MSEWVIKEHPDFFKELNKLGMKELRIFWKKREKIKTEQERAKHLGGDNNCHREPITNNIRLIYAIQGNEVWLLAISRHEDAYQDYLKRIYSLKTKYLDETKS